MGNADEKTELAEERTDFAEDRTLLANERTYGGWMRTGLAALGIALGFNAILQMAERTWMAKAGATLFVLIAIAIFLSAHRNAYKIVDRMEEHEIKSIRTGHLRLITAILVLGAIILAGLLWTI